MSRPRFENGAERPGSGEPPIHLTPRQREVLRLLGEGRSTEEMANELVLSKTTVRNHVAHVISALGAHSRLQAVIKGAQAGLIGSSRQ